MTSFMIVAPNRIRTNEGSFAYIPHRFLRDGFYGACTSAERSVYLLLVLAADRNGVSFYRRDTIAGMSGLGLRQVEEAFEGLESKDLVACGGRLVQVLSLPAEPPRGQQVPRWPPIPVRGGQEPPGADALRAFRLRMEKMRRGQV